MKIKMMMMVMEKVGYSPYYDSLCCSSFQVNYFIKILTLSIDVKVVGRTIY